MKKASRIKHAEPEMRDHYDVPWDKAVRGKYAGRFPKDCIMVVLDPDVAEMFPDAKSANAALRAISGIIKQNRKIA